MSADDPVVAGRRTIVVVEDDPEIRDLETFLLATEGYHVVGLADGEEVAATVKHVRADVVLLDLMLPRKNGNAVLQELQRDPATNRVPVIVVSAYTKQLRGTPQVKRVIAKPFDLTELLDAVAASFEGRGER